MRRMESALSVALAGEDRPRVRMALIQGVTTPRPAVTTGPVTLHGPGITQETDVIPAPWYRNGLTLR